MESHTRAFLAVCLVVIVVALGASWLFCAGLSDLLHWDSCTTLLGATTSAIQWVAALVGRARGLAAY